MNQVPLPWVPSPTFLKFAIAMLLAGSIAAVTTTLAVAPDQIPRLVSQAGYGAVALLGWYLLAHERGRASQYVLVVGTWVVVTVSAAFTGGLRAPVIIAYPALIVFGGWIFGRRDLLLIALATVVLLIGFTVADHAHALPPPYQSSPALQMVVQIIIVACSAGLIANLARTYREQMTKLQQVGSDLARRTGELESSKSLLDKAQAVAKVGSWVYSFGERRLELSAEAARILNLPRDIDGDIEYFLSLVHPEDRDSTHKSWLAAIASGRFDNQHRVSVSGESRWLRQTAEIERTPEGHAHRVVGIVLDITERKLVEDSLRRSEELFSTAFRSSPLAASISRPHDGYVIDANTNYERYFGWKRDELVGKTTAASGLWLSPDHRAAWLAKLLSEGRVIEWVTTWRHKQGHLLDVSISAELVDVQDETCILAYIADISARRKAERELQDSAALLRTVIDEIPDPIILKDENANFLLCNQSLANLYNTVPANMIGKQDGDFGVPSEMAEFFRNNVLTLMAKGETEVIFEDSEDVLTGEIRHFRSVKKPFRNAEGRNRILIVAHDITDIVRSQALIAENEKRLQEVMTVTQEGVWDWHIPTGRVLHNAQWYRSLGLVPGEFPETVGAFRELVHDDDRDTVLVQIDAMLSGTSDSYSSQHRLRHGDGHYIWVKDRGRIVERDATGNPLRIIGSFGDITEAKRNQDELERHRNHLEELVASRTTELAAARDAAEEASRAKSLFLSNMSHELRTPMNAIMGMTNLALRQATLPQQSDWLSKSLDASQHLLDVINDILDVSRIEANRVVLEERNFSPAQVVQEAISMQSESARAKGLRLVTQLGPTLPDQLRGDAMRLRQIVINFLGNAVKFSEQGDIAVGVWQASRDSRSALIRLEVTDHGIGISPEQQARLFQAFSQADTSMSRRYGGTGLGLVISKRIANLMDGDVGVISSEGQGSTFWAEIRLKLPEFGATKSDAKATESPRDRLIQNFTGVRILLAEDEVLNQEVTAQLLQDAGLRPDIASNGKEAVRLATATDYALILMDVRMPAMNGLEATRAIRLIPGREATPILAMTANAFDEDRAQCLAAGMNAHLGKPYRPDDLYSNVLQFLSASNR